MKTFSIAIKTLRKDIKNTLFYGFTIFTSICSMLTIFNIVNNLDLQKYAYIEMAKLEGIEIDISFFENFNSAASFGGIIPIILVIASICTIFFANNYYLTSQTKNMASISLAGGTPFDNGYYVFYQNMIICGITMPLGVLFGFIFNYLITSSFYSICNISGISAATIFPNTIIFMGLIIFMILVWIMLIDGGYAYRQNLVDLLKESKKGKVKGQGLAHAFTADGLKESFEFSMNATLINNPLLGGLQGGELPKTVIPKERVYVPKVKSKISRILSVILPIIFILSPLVLGLFLNAGFASFIIMFALPALAIIGFIENAIPEIIKFLKNRYFLNKGVALISISNFNATLSSCGILIILLQASIILIVSNSMSLIFKYEQLLNLVGTTIILLLVGVSIVFKLLMDIKTRKDAYIGLYNTGYTYNNIRSIVRNEVLYFYSFIMVFVFINILPFIMTFRNSNLDYSIIINILIAFIVVMLICTIITYILYIRLVKPTLLTEREGE